MRVCVSIIASLVTASAGAHDMFLVVPDHDFAAGSQITVALYNGTFSTSENTIDRDRMTDVTVVDGQGKVTHPGTEQWREEGNVTVLNIEPGAPGTYLVGVSTSPRVLELSGEEFDEYLAHDGVLDVLETRKESGATDSAVSERYSKHVKTILQVGEGATDTWAHRLGYPVEFVPLSSPGELCPGDTLEFEVLSDNQRLAGQRFYASYEGHHEHGSGGGHREAIAARSDAQGVGRIVLDRSGRWYLRMIQMRESSEEGIDYESRWATLTFEVGCLKGD